MKVGLIAPKAMATYASLGDYFFITPSNVTEYYKDQAKFKMLDNGAYETGNPLDTTSILGLADYLQVNEIVLPDVIGNYGRTVQLIEEFLLTTPKRKLKYAAVPQGSTPSEWIGCYRYLATMKDIDVLCIPVWLQKKFQCRAAIVRYLIKRGYWSTKEHHLIGLDSVAELLLYGEEIRSVDTSLPFTEALRGYHELFDPECRLTRVSFDFAPDPLSVYYSKLKANIHVLLEAAHSVG